MVSFLRACGLTTRFHEEGRLGNRENLPAFGIQGRRLVISLASQQQVPLLQTLGFYLYHHCLYFFFLITLVSLAGKLSPPGATLQKTLLFWQAVVAGRLIGGCLTCRGQLSKWVTVQSALGGKHG